MKITRLLLAAAAAGALLGAAPARAAEPELTTSLVAFDNRDGETLRGLVYAPRAAAEPLPGLVLVHGSGPGAHATLATEAKAFAAQGIAVLAYDKRRVGYSDTVRDYAALADDVVAGVDLLRARPGITTVGVWGISEGGWVAPLAAARSSHVAFLIAASAPGLTPMRTENWNTRNKIHAAGVRGSAVSALSDRPLRLFEELGSFAESRHDPRPVLAAVSQPVLAVYGSEDVQVPPAESAEVFAATVRGHLSVRVVPGAGHLLKVRSGGGSYDTAWPGYPELVGAWVRAVTAGAVPAEAVDPLPAQRLRSEDVTPAAWWEGWRVQVAAFALVLLLPLTYPGWTAVRWLRVRGQLAGARAPGRGAARALAVLVPGAAAGGFGYLVFVLTGGNWLGIHPGPLLGGRPAGWLVAQAAAVAAVIAAVPVARHWRCAGADRPRLAVLLAGAAIFIPWALYWGLLRP